MPRNPESPATLTLARDATSVRVSAKAALRNCHPLGWSNSDFSEGGTRLHIIREMGSYTEAQRVTPLRPRYLELQLTIVRRC